MLFSDNALYGQMLLAVSCSCNMPSCRQADITWDLLLVYRILSGHQISGHPGLKEFCMELRSLPIPSAPLLCFMVTMYEQEAVADKGTPKGKQSLDASLEVS